MLRDAPVSVLQDFYDRESGNQIPFQDYLRHVFQNLDPEDIEAIGNTLHSKYYTDISKEQYDETSGMQAWRDNRPSWFGNVARGAGERAADLAGGLAELVNSGAQIIGLEDSQAAEMASTWAQKMRDVDFGYMPDTKWEDIEGPWTLFKFAMEQGLISVPDMAALLMGPIGVGTYIGARTGELMQERRTMDRRDIATATDFLASLPAATASALLDRLGAKGMLGLANKESKNAILKQADKIRQVLPKRIRPDLPKDKSLKALGGAVGRAALTESVTEAAQEGIEHTAVTAGTEHGLRSEELGHAALVGGTVGAVFGGTVRGVTAKGQQLMGATEEASLEDQKKAEDDRQARRHQSSADLEAEVEQGIRRPINEPGSIRPGDRVMVSPWEGQAEIGTADFDESTGIMRFLDDNGQVIGSFDINNPGQEFSFYTLSDDETAAEDSPTGEPETPEDEEQRRYEVEIGRLIERVEKKPQSARRREALDKLRQDPRWESLPDGLKDHVEDILDWSEPPEGTDAQPAQPPAGGAPPPAKPPVEEKPKPDTESPQPPVDEKPKETERPEPKPEEKPKPAPKPVQPTKPEETDREPIATRPLIETVEGAETPRTGVIRWSDRGEQKAAPVQYAVVELEDVLESHTEQGEIRPGYPLWKQPRDRSKGETIKKTSERIQNFDPTQPTAMVDVGQIGAPLIDRTGVVEGGNGRIIAIRGVYERAAQGSTRHQNMIERYQKIIGEMGYRDTDVKQPVLVRVRQDDMPDDELRRFIDYMNSSVEEVRDEAADAIADSKNITADLLDVYTGGGIDTVSNKEFISRYVNTVIPTNYRDRMLDLEGRLTEAGARRIETAIIHRAFEDERITRNFFTNSYKGQKTLRNALAEIAPKWAVYRNAVETGWLTKAWDIQQDLPTLVLALSDYFYTKARKGYDTLPNIMDIIEKRDLFGAASEDVTDPEVRRALGMMFFNVEGGKLKRYARKKGDPVTDRLASAANIAKKYNIFLSFSELSWSDPNQQSLFGDIVQDDGGITRSDVKQFINELADLNFDEMESLVTDLALQDDEVVRERLTDAYGTMMVMALRNSGVIEDTVAQALINAKERIANRGIVPAPSDDLANEMSDMVMRGFVSFDRYEYRDEVPEGFIETAKKVSAYIQSLGDDYEAVDENVRYYLDLIADSYRSWSPKERGAETPPVEETPEPEPTPPPEPEVVEDDAEVEDDPVDEIPVPEPEPKPPLSPPVEPQPEPEPGPPEDTPEPRLLDGEIGTPWRTDEVNYEQALQTVREQFFGAVRDVSDGKTPATSTEKEEMEAKAVYEELDNLVFMEIPWNDQSVERYINDVISATMWDEKLRSAYARIKSGGALIEGGEEQIIKSLRTPYRTTSSRRYAKMRLARHFIVNAVASRSSVWQDHGWSRYRVLLDVRKNILGPVVSGNNEKKFSSNAHFVDDDGNVGDLTSVYNSRDDGYWNGWTIFPHTDPQGDPDVWFTLSTNWKRREDYLERAYNETMNSIWKYQKDLGGKESMFVLDWYERRRRENPHAIGAEANDLLRYVNDMMSDSSFDAFVVPAKSRAAISSKRHFGSYADGVRKSREWIEKNRAVYDDLPQEFKDSVDEKIQRFEDKVASIPPALEPDEVGSESAPWDPVAVSYADSFEPLVRKYMSEAPGEPKQYDKAKLDWAADLAKDAMVEFVTFDSVGIHPQVGNYLRDVLTTAGTDYQDQMTAARDAASDLGATAESIKKNLSHRFSTNGVAGGYMSESYFFRYLGIAAKLRLTRHLVDGAMRKSMMSDAPTQIMEAREVLIPIVGVNRTFRKDSTHLGKQLEPLGAGHPPTAMDRVIIEIDKISISTTLYKKAGSVDFSRQDNKEFNDTLNNLDKYLKEWAPPEVEVDIAPRPRIDVDDAEIEKTLKGISDIIEEGLDDDLGDVESDGSVYFQILGETAAATLTAQELRNIPQLDDLRLKDASDFLVAEAQVVTAQLKAEGREATHEERKRLTMIDTILKSVQSEINKRRDISPWDNLPRLYKTKLTKTVGLRDGKNVDLYMLYNINARKPGQHQLINGMKDLLIQNMPELSKIDKDPFKALGGSRNMMAHSKNKDKMGYEFRTNPFVNQEVVDALNLEPSEEVLEIWDTIDTPSGDAIAQFKAIDHAPKVEPQMMPGKAAETLIRNGVKLGFIENDIAEGQIEDVGRINQAMDRGKRGFVLGLPTGSGKTFVLGASMKDILSRDKKANILFITRSQNLITQAKSDLDEFLGNEIRKGDVPKKRANFPPVAGSVRMVSYAKILRLMPEGETDFLRLSTNHPEMVKMRANLANYVNSDTVIMMDEGHFAKNIRGKTMAALYHFVTRSRFNVLSSATPFTNPATAQYLYWLGVFDGWEAQVLQGSPPYVDMLSNFGAIAGGQPEIAQLYPNSDHPFVSVNMLWRRRDKEWVFDNTTAFLRWMVENGTYISRLDLLDPAMTVNDFEMVSPARKYIAMSNLLGRVYHNAKSITARRGGNPLELAGHETNLQKRLAETAKVEEMADMTMRELFHPKRIVSWKDSRGGQDNPSDLLKDMIEADKKEDTFEWHSLYTEYGDTPIRKYLLVTNSDGKKTMALKLRTGEEVTVEVEERKVVSFIETKQDRWINKFKVSKDKNIAEIFDNDPASIEDRTLDKKRGRTYSIDEVLEYHRWLEGQIDPDSGDFWLRSKFGAWQVSLAEAMTESHRLSENSIKLPGLKQSVKDALLERGLAEEDIGFFTGDETSDERTGVKEAFQKQKNPRVMIVTMAAGGTGLSLHDTLGPDEGGMPRSLVGIILPWEAILMTQTLGRVSRLGMKSISRVKWLVASDFEVERRLSERLRDRLQDMGFSTTGATPPSDGSITEVIDAWTDISGYSKKYDENGKKKITKSPTPEITIEPQDDAVLMQRYKEAVAKRDEVVDNIRNAGRNDVMTMIQGIATDVNSDRFQTPPPDVANRMTALALRLGPRVRTRFQKWILDIAPDGSPLGIGGKFWYGGDDPANSVLTVAQSLGPYFGYKPNDMAQTIGHEMLHYFRNNGLLTDAEYNVLRDYAVKNNMLEKYKIAERYANLQQDGRIEEAIAEMFGDYVAQKESERSGMFTASIRDLFDRIIAFFNEVFERFFGRAPTAQGVMQRMYLGQVGQRPDRGVIAGSGGQKRRQNKMYGQYRSKRQFHPEGITDATESAIQKEYDARVGSEVTVRLDLHDTKQDKPRYTIRDLRGKDTIRNVAALRFKLNMKMVDKVYFSTKVRVAKESNNRSVHAHMVGELMELGDVPQVHLNFPEYKWRRISYFYGRVDGDRQIGFYLQDRMSDNALAEIKDKTGKLGGGRLHAPLSKRTTDEMQEGAERLKSLAKSNAEVIATGSGLWLDMDTAGGAYRGDLSEAQLDVLRNIDEAYENITDLVNEFQQHRFIHIADQDITLLNNPDFVSAASEAKAVSRMTGNKNAGALIDRRLAGALQKNHAVLKALKEKYLFGYEVEREMLNAVADELAARGLLDSISQDGSTFYTKKGYSLRISSRPFVDGVGIVSGKKAPDFQVVTQYAMLNNRLWMAKKHAEAMQYVDRIDEADSKDGGDTRHQAFTKSFIEGISGKSEQKPHVEFAKPENEARFRQAQKGIERDGFWSRTKETLADEMHKFTRHRSKVDPGKRQGKYNADFLQKTRHLESVPDSVVEKIENFFYRVSAKKLTDAEWKRYLNEGDYAKLTAADRKRKGLSKADYDLFTRATILPDLIWTIDQGMEVPYGYESREDLVRDKQEVDRVLNSHLRVKAAVEMRRQMLDDIRTSMIQSGYMPPSRLQNTHYFHHQVIEYAQLKKTGAGGRKIASGFWHARKGSYKDINADYFQAEAAWMFKAMNDVEVAKFGNWLRTSKYNSKFEFKRQAISDNSRHLFSHLINDIYDGLVHMGSPRAINLARKYQPNSQEFVHPIELMRRFTKDLKKERLKDDFEALSMGGQHFAKTKAYNDFRKNIARYVNSLIFSTMNMNPKFFENLPPDIKRTLRQLFKIYQDPEMEDDTSKMLEVASWFSNRNEPEYEKMKMISLGLLKNISLRKKWTKDTLGNSYVDPQNTSDLLAAYGDKGKQKLWQMDSYDGKTRAVHMYTAYTVPEHIFERTVGNILEAFESETGIKDAAQLLHGLPHGSRRKVELNLREVAELVNNMREQTVVGGPKEEMILPDYIADTLNEFRDPFIEGLFGKITASIQSRWKMWILFMPRRVFKYSLNNTVSDIDALLANPSATPAFKYMPRAFKEMYRYIYDGEAPGETLTEAMNYGVINSTLTNQEIPHRAFRRLDMTNDYELYDRDIAMSLDGAKNRYNFVRGYFDAVSRAIRLRESSVRYAAYLHYRKALFEDGLTPKDIGFGATPPWMAEGTTSKLDMAALMARDALGDYGNLGEHGRMLRQRVIPFWSWAESNMRRYLNLFRNIPLYAGTKKGTAAVGVATSLGVRMFMVYAMINLWNYLFFGDEEELLGTEESLQLHLNLGEWGGEKTSLRFQGALSDFLGWMNMEDAGAVFKDIQDGHATYTDVMREMLKGPFNRVVQGFNPMFKVPVELATGKVFYPDVFNPYSMQDPWEHVSRTFALQEEYKGIANYAGYPVPSKGYWRWGNLADIFVYRRLEGELKTRQIRRDAYQWLERTQMQGERRRLFNAYRKALQYEDYGNAERIEERLVKVHGATDRSFKMMHQRIGPLGMMPSKKVRKEYLQFLSPAEREEVLAVEKQWLESRRQ